MFTYDELVRMETLPDSCDHYQGDDHGQHDLLLRLLRRLLLALKEEHLYAAHRQADVLTLFLYNHFLDEENEMAGLLSWQPELHGPVTRHLEDHAVLLQEWDHQVLFPLKQGESLAQVKKQLVHFCNTVLDHLAEQSDISRGNLSSLRRMPSCFPRGAELPLPHLGGAYYVVHATARQTARSLELTALPAISLAELPPLPAVGSSAPLLPGRRCVRDAVAALFGARLPDCQAAVA